MALIRFGLFLLSNYFKCKPNDTLKDDNCDIDKICPCQTINSFNNILMTIIFDLMTLLAIYLALKCKGKFVLTEFLLAGLLGPIYISYRIFITNSCKDDLWKF